MSKYGPCWQSSKNLAADLKQWRLDHADKTSTVFSAFAFAHLLNLHLETEDELLCEFCVAKVKHLSYVRVVRVRLGHSATCDGQKFSLSKSKTYTRFHVFMCEKRAETMLIGLFCK